ncbi:MAG: HAMP domain-containing histidine kinase [Cyanobacteria bacterium SBLK]|nr:HAMP domain-containing histidine kinase [Cyanobacteria bacterium SBLK]
MFSKIRLQLITYYLIVLAIILTIFTIAIRLTFSRSLHDRLVRELTALAQLAAEELQEEDGLEEIEASYNGVLKGVTVPKQTTIQWFDGDGKLLAQIGDDRLKPTLDRKDPIQTILFPESLKIVVFPVAFSDGGEGEAYVRIARDLDDLEETVENLDWGLGIGFIIALGLSGAGGLWLTRKSMKPIEESYQRLQQFTADASHELRSPLMAIKTNAAVALKYSRGMREGDFEKFSAIASASNQLTRLTENLLMLARLDRNIRSQREAINLTELLQNLLDLYQSRITEKKLNLRENFAKNLEVIGDETQLFRLFVNLLENAIRYTPENGKILISAKQETEKILVSVKDTGIGIAPEDCDRIFDRFWQADLARSYRNSSSQFSSARIAGAGLGLAIAREIARAHGGDISVFSVLEQGSCFTVSFPLVTLSI